MRILQCIIFESTFTKDKNHTDLITKRCCFAFSFVNLLGKIFP